MLPLLKLLQKWRRRQAAISHLCQLDDRLLADMGTSRQEIEVFVTGEGSSVKRELKLAEPKEPHLVSRTERCTFGTVSTC